MEPMNCVRKSRDEDGGEMLGKILMSCVCVCVEKNVTY